MRIDTIIESKMADLAAIFSDIRSLSSAKVSIDENTFKVYMNFFMYGEHGKICLKARSLGSYEKTSKRFRSLIYAAAVSSMNGKKPMNFKEALNAVTGSIRPGALKILTNPENWEIEKISHAGFNIGYKVTENVDLGSKKISYQKERDLAHSLGVGLDKNWISKLSNEEKSALVFYRDGGHKSINAGLRNINIELPSYLTDPDEIHKEYKFKMSVSEAINLIDSAIEKSSFNKDVVVYRGFKSYAPKNMNEGDSYIDPAFVSTTLHSQYALAGFSVSRLPNEEYTAQPIMRIIVKRGTPAAYISYEDGTEAEVLLGRNRKFTLVKKEIKKSRTRHFPPYEELTFVVD